MHSVTEIPLLHQARTLRTMRAQRMRFVDHHQAIAALGDLEQLQQRRQAAVGTVQGIDDDHAAAMFFYLAPQVCHVVVQEGDGLGLGRQHALPQRSMGLHVQVNGNAGTGYALEQATLAAMPDCARMPSSQPMKLASRRSRRCCSLPSCKYTADISMPPALACREATWA